MEKRAVVSEERAREILRRAAEIDRSRGEVVTLQTLRNSAIEAGISEAAFDQAVADEAALEAPHRQLMSRRAMFIAAGITAIGFAAAALRRRMVPASPSVINHRIDTPLARPDSLRA